MMQAKKLETSKVLNSAKQKFAKLIHTFKARNSTKERKRCQTLGQYFSPGSVVLDIGGHFGYFSKEFARLYNGTCSIHTFEPTTYNYSVLEKVSAKYKNIKINNFALSESEGEVVINIPVKKQGKIGPGLAHFGDETSRDYISETIKTVTLDQYVESHGLTRLDFIKCDVEGAELLVFKGAQESLKKFKPVVFAEIVAEITERMGYEPNELINIFLELGYTAYTFDDSLVKSEELKSYTVASDYLFLPPAN